MTRAERVRLDVPLRPPSSAGVARYRGCLVRSMVLLAPQRKVPESRQVALERAWPGLFYGGPGGMQYMTIITKGK
jgi:hypothetical protein